MLPTWHGIPAKAFQVSFPASHLARNSCKSVPGVLFRCPPGTEFLQKCGRCHFLPSTWHGIPAKAFQVASPCFPPGTEFLRKCTRCPFPLSTWHGIPAKVYQVSFSVVHLARFSCESVPGVLSRLPPATESLQKCGRCHFLPSTCHGIPAKVFQVSFPAVHLPRNSCESVPGVLLCRPPATVVPLIMGCRGFSAGHVDVFSMKRATISTPEVGKCVHLSENHDVLRMAQLRVSHVWTHLQYQNRLAGAYRAHLSLRVC